jgi:hypothetical protein
MNEIREKGRGKYKRRKYEKNKRTNEEKANNVGNIEGKN